MVRKQKNKLLISFCRKVVSIQNKRRLKYGNYLFKTSIFKRNVKYFSSINKLRFYTHTYTICCSTYEHNLRAIFFCVYSVVIGFHPLLIHLLIHFWSIDFLGKSSSFVWKEVFFYYSNESSSAWKSLKVNINRKWWCVTMKRYGKNSHEVIIY